MAFDQTALTFKVCLDLSHSIPQETVYVFVEDYKKKNNFTIINMYLFFELLSSVI